MLITRIGTAYGQPDTAGRIALFGIMGLSDDADVLTVRYEGTHHQQDTILVSYPDRHALIDLPRTAFDTVKYTRYHGTENATADRVVHYLLTNYNDKLGRSLTPAYLRSVVIGSPDLVQAEELLSYAFYPGNNIADALGFQPLSDDDIDNPEDTDDDDE